MKVWIARLASLAILAGLMSCGEKDTAKGPAMAPGPLRLAVVSGDGQEAPVGDVLPDSLVVRVTDEREAPIANCWVDFRLVEGEGRLLAPVALTDRSGRAAVAVVLDRPPGPRQVEARLYGTDQAVLFTVAALVPEPASLAAVQGEGQKGFVETALRAPLQVLVRDKHGQPVEGAVIAFTIEEGDGMLSALFDTTSIAGLAETTLRLGDLPETIRVRAATLDSAFVVDFAATAVLGPAAIATARGDGETWFLEEELPQPLQALVMDELGQPVEGVPVGFAVVDGVATLSADQDTTSAAGLAETRLHLGKTVGTVRVRATILETALATDFTVSARRVGPAAIAAVHGDGQIGLEGGALLEPLRVEVRDDLDRVMEGVSIVFNIEEGTANLSVAYGKTSEEGLTETTLRLRHTPGTVRVRARVLLLSSLPPLEVYFTATVMRRDLVDGVAYLPGGETLAVVWIEPGTFTMGSPESEWEREENEGPQHEVTITRGFYLGQYELTQAQWESVMGTRPWSGRSYAVDNPDYPATYISWYDVQDFIRRVNGTAGAVLLRLPTEAEWEYACRAGTTSPWSFGGDEVAQSDAAARKAAEDYGCGGGCEVGSKLPNPWGLYDMHGSVWEWVQDIYSATYYEKSPSVDPRGPGWGSTRVMRSGSQWVERWRSAARIGFSMNRGNHDIGTRLVWQEP